MKFVPPYRKLAHDIRDFLQQVVSTCHLLLVQTGDEWARTAANQLLENCRAASKNFNILLEEVIPMKTPPLNIMVVEDDPTTRNFLSTTLKQQNHKVVVVADNGNDMVDLALNNDSIQLILFDIHLPGQDGLAALEQIVQAGKIIPALAITGDQDLELADRAAEQQVCFNYIFKPVEPPDLAVKLRVAWAKWREFEAIREENLSLHTKIAGLKLINRAKGMLCRRNRWTEDQAHHHMEKYAQNTRLGMIAVAKMVLEGKSINENKLLVCGTGSVASAAAGASEQR